MFFSQNSIDDDGRLFLIERGLSIPHCIKYGVSSKDGMLGFAFLKDGIVVRQKFRDLKDKKIQRFNKLSDENQHTFKMPFFNQFKCPTSEDLIITEGEFDCIALLQLGAINVASLPNGASCLEKTFKDQYLFLQQFERIFIATDNDDAGNEAAKKAMKLISAHKYRRLIFKDCKDANEWIFKNPELELSDLEHALYNATKIENPCIVNMKDLPDSYYEEIDLGISSGWNGLDKIIGGIRKGEVTVFTADTGAGKSTFTINLLKNLADQGKGIWLNSFEMDAKIVNRKMACKVLKKFIKFQAFSIEDKKNYKDYLNKKNCNINPAKIKVDTLILRNLFELAAHVHNVEYVLIDHLDYIHCNGKKKTALENIDDSMREIHSLAMEFNLGVILVAHPKQVNDGDEITMSDIKGSSSIKQYADNVIVLSRMDRFDSKDKNRVKIKVWKNRLCGLESSFFMRYNQEIDGYEDIL